MTKYSSYFSFIFSTILINFVKKAASLFLYRLRVKIFSNLMFQNHFAFRVRCVFYFIHNAAVLFFHAISCIPVSFDQQIQAKINF